MKSVSQRTIAIDYGTANPMRFLDIYDDQDIIRVVREYSWDSRKKHRQKTDKEYADDLEGFIGDEQAAIIVDPSAASFIAELRSRGLYVVPAKNDVLDGIRKTASMIQRRKIKISTACEEIMNEMGVYMWDEKAAQAGKEQPIKQNDHSLDALRYYVNVLPTWRFE